MADTTLETALVALAAALDAATTAEVIRNASHPEEVPAAGLVILRDGSQVEAEVSMSPLRYHIDHQAEVAVHAQTEAARGTILKALSGALVANRTLTGAIEFLEVGSVSLADADLEGGAGIPGALMPVVMSYTTLGSPAA